MQIKPTLVIVALFLTGSLAAAQPAVHVDHAGLKKLGWQQAFASNSFKDLSLFEIIETLHGLDVHHIALYPGHRLAPSPKDVTFSHDSPAEVVDALLAKLKEAKLDIVTYHLDVPPKDDAAIHKVFEFAKKLKVKNIVIPQLSAEAQPGWQKEAADNKINLVLYSDEASDTAAALDVATAAKAGHDIAQRIKMIKRPIVEVNLQGADAPSVAAAVAEMKKQNYKGIFTVGCEPASGQEAINNAAAALNNFSAAVTKAAAEN